MFKNEINRIKRLKLHEVVKMDEIKNLEEIEIEMINLKGRIRIERIKNNLENFEMNESEAEVAEEIKILKEK